MDSYHQVVQIRIAHPSWMQTKIGIEAGISRQRVHQILKKASLPTRAVIFRSACEQCGLPMKRRERFCGESCRRTFYYDIFRCDVCGKEKIILRSRKRGKAFYCSKFCQGKWLGRNKGFGRKKSGPGQTREIVSTMGAQSS